MGYFWHSDSYNFGYILGNISKLHLEILHKFLKTRQHWYYSYYSTKSQIFLIYKFLTIKRRPLQKFLKFTRKFILFLLEKNNTTSFVIVHLKCTFVHYANLNSNSVNKSFLNYGLSNMLFRFFWFLIYVYFNEAIAKTFIKKLSSFNINFQNSFQDVAYSEY